MSLTYCLRSPLTLIQTMKLNCFKEFLLIKKTKKKTKKNTHFSVIVIPIQ